MNRSLGFLAGHLAFLMLLGCGARTDLEEGATGAGGASSTTGVPHSTISATSTSVTSTRSAASTIESASSGIPFVQCGCPDDPGFVKCPTGLDCCACNDDGLGWTVDRCEDPSTFNCSCGNPLSCLGG